MYQQVGHLLLYFITHGPCLPSLDPNLNCFLFTTLHISCMGFVFCPLISSPDTNLVVLQFSSVLTLTT